MGFEEMCRRQMRLRVAAIRTAIDQRQAVVDAVAGPDRIDREASRRLLRAQRAATTEREIRIG